MKVKIPIFIILLNDSELALYKNKKFVPYLKFYLDNFGVYENCIFLYAGKENESYLKDANIKNIYEVKSLEVISHKDEFIAVYNYIKDFNMTNDWFITIQPNQIIKNNNTIYTCIQNIEYKYDFLCFSTAYLDKHYLRLENGKLKYKFLDYTDKYMNIIDTSLFVTNSEWFMKCCEESELNEPVFSSLFWSGNYKILDLSDQITINLNTKGQVDNFIDFLENYKIYSK